MGKYFCKIDTHDTDVIPALMHVAILVPLDALKHQLFCLGPSVNWVARYRRVIVDRKIRTKIALAKTREPKGLSAGTRSSTKNMWVALAKVVANTPDVLIRIRWLAS